MLSFAEDDLIYQLNQVGSAASLDLVEARPVLDQLHDLVGNPHPFVAGVALQIANDFDIIQFGVVEVRLKPIILTAVQHPHWWVRYQATRVLDSPPIRVYAALSSDSVSAVVAGVAEDLVYLPDKIAVRLVRRLASDNQAIVFARLKQLGNCPDFEEHNKARKLHERLTSSIAQPTSKVDADVSSRWHEGKLKATDWLQMPAEEITLLLHTPCSSLISLDHLERILQAHPDPIARITALNAWDYFDTGPNQERYHAALARAARDEHLAVQLMAVIKLQWEANARNYHSLGRLLLRLTEHPCLPIVQVAARGLRECCDTPLPDQQLIDRLLELTKHEDCLVRVNSLYALQDYYYAPKTVRHYLLKRWEEEPVSRVRVAIAETLWWWMEPAEWLASLGVWLQKFERGRWWRLGRNLIALWSGEEIKEMLGMVRNPSQRQLLKCLLKRR